MPKSDSIGRPEQDCLALAHLQDLELRNYLTAQLIPASVESPQMERVYSLGC